MEIGIVNEKNSKYKRWFFYTTTPIFLVVLFALLQSYIEMNFLLISLIILIGISAFILIEKYVDGFNILGIIEINDNSLEIFINSKSEKIDFQDITFMELNPKLGLSKSKETFTIYEVKIRTKDENYTYLLTREELRNRKLIRKNLFNPNAFDLIKFLEKKRIKFEFGKRIY